LAVRPTHVSGTWWRQVPAGADPLYRPEEPPDGRWQHGDVVEAMYFADSAATAWAEWYRRLAETGIPPLQALPRELWAWEVSLTRVADLRGDEELASLGLGRPGPNRHDWPAFQAVGDALCEDGWPALIAPSAARPEGFVLCVFRAVERPPGVAPMPPPRLFDEPPPPPQGMTT
jgi:RES domain-containing protein